LRVTLSALSQASQVFWSPPDAIMKSSKRIGVASWPQKARGATYYNCISNSIWTRDIGSLSDSRAPNLSQVRVKVQSMWYMRFVIEEELQSYDVGHRHRRPTLRVNCHDTLPISTISSAYWMALLLHRGAQRRRWALPSARWTQRRGGGAAAEWAQNEEESAQSGIGSRNKLKLGKYGQRRSLQAGPCCPQHSAGSRGGPVRQER
jgi:hypothetical protein